MRRSRSMRLWTDPDGEMPLAYHHLSYILFRCDRDDVLIVGARCPEPERFAVGSQLTRELQLDEEAQTFLFSTSEDSLLFVDTNMGVGILDMRYRRHAGLGIYWHIHAHPDCLSRLINGGVWGDANSDLYRISRRIAEGVKLVRASDIPYYEVLRDAWRVVAREPGSWISCDADGCIYAEELMRLMERMALFVGCRLVREASEGTTGRVKCRRPALMEACLLCLLTGVRIHSAEGCAFFEVRSLGDLDGEGVSLTLRYPVLSVSKVHDEMDDIYHHVKRVSGLSGLDAHLSVIPPKYGEKKLGKLTEICISLDWVYDPTVLPTSDLKAEPELEG